MAKRTLDSASSGASCKKSRLLKAKEKKSCAATIEDLPVKMMLFLKKCQVPYIWILVIGSWYGMNV